MLENNETLGTYLKRSRTEKNISIEQVAYATRISLKMLRSLEEDAHEVLPAPTFVRGYLQAYAKYVRIDTQDLLLRYQHHLATSPDGKRNTIRSHYLYVRERYQEKRRLVLVIVLFATMLSVAGTYFLLKAKRDQRKQLAQATHDIQKGETAKPDPALAGLVAPTSPANAPAPEADAKDAKSAKDSKDAKEAKTPAEEPKKMAEVKTPEPPKSAPAPSPAATPPPAIPAPAVAAAPASPAAATDPAKKDEKKNYNLLLKAETDVWLRFQTDEDGVRDLTLRTGRAIMLRANNVIKIFSGNLGALKATMNGQPVATLTSGERSKSVVLPATEASKYPLPLFPQFASPAATNSAGPANTNSGSGAAAQ